MDRTVADLNIKHFKQRLESETDPEKRLVATAGGGRSEAERPGAASRRKLDWTWLGLSPLAPMSGAKDDSILRFGVDPALRTPPAGENQRMHGIAFDDCKLQVAVEWCCRDLMPHAASLAGSFIAVLIHIT
jgi:hypothetical protein